MINIDDRLLNDLTGDELAVFCHILKRIGKTNKSWPSRNTLQKDTGYGREKIYKSITGLIKKNIITSFQAKNETGKFEQTIYTIKTQLASIYIPAKGEQLESRKHKILNRDTENRETENPHAGKQLLSINNNISINNINNKSINFYEKEISQNLETSEINNYKKFIGILIGNNKTDEMLNGLLSLPIQVSYKVFTDLINESRKRGKKFSSLMLKANNDSKYYKGKNSLPIILYTWLETEYS